MLKKIVVWDLFGGGQNSVYNTLKEHKMLDKYDIYTFDVVESKREKQFKVDLSKDNIIEILSEFPAPDIIVASPLCNSFSSVLSMKGGGTCFWKYKDKSKTELIERSVEEFERLKSGFTGKLKADTQLFIKKIGQKCIDNTLKIISYYKPKCFYIENPLRSLMWKYIEFNRSDFYDATKHHKNKASLGMYGYFTNKPAIFLSNVKMNLKYGKIERPYYEVLIDGINYCVSKKDGRMIKQSNTNSGMKGLEFVRRGAKTIYQKDKKSSEQISEANVVSSIPHDLIKDIFDNFENYLERKWSMNKKLTKKELSNNNLKEMEF